MRKQKIAVLVLGFAILLFFFGGKLWWQARKEVVLSDITFLVEEQGRETALKLWHNYYDGKEYLFLPAFCGKEASFRVRQENRLRGSWDGDTVYNWTVLHGLEEGSYEYSTGQQSFTVVVMRSAAVPSLFLTTQSGSLSYVEAEKGNGEPGMYEMVLADGTLAFQGRMDELRSRGNATFLEDKKPYQMSLDGPEDLLGAGAASRYILLANRQDQSLIRDKIVYDLADDMGLAYSPESLFVDLYINGEYRGSYQLCEKVEVGENRVDIDTTKSGEGMGFLVEFEYDRRSEEVEHLLVTGGGQNLQVRSPKMPADQQMTHILRRFQRVEDAVLAGNLAAGDMDVTSFARKYLIEEISKNLDAMHSSQYFYKDDDSNDSTVYAGPVWDYDKSLGNPFIERTRPVNYQDPWGIFAATEQDGASWWYDLYRQPDFYEAMVAEYEKTAAPCLDVMLSEKIDSYVAQIKASAYMDYMRWDTFEDFKNGEALEFEEEYEAEIETIKDFLRERMQFLTAVWLEERVYNRVSCDSAGGEMYVTYIEAVEGFKLHMPRDPKMEGYRFKQWRRQDTGQVYDFETVYDGQPFTLVAEYEKKEE